MVIDELVTVLSFNVDSASMRSANQLEGQIDAVADVANNAGRAMDAAANDAQVLGRAIDGVDAGGLPRAESAADGVGSSARGASSAIDSLGSAISGIAGGVFDSLANSIGGANNSATMLVATLGSLGVGVGMANRYTTEFDNMAQSVGLTTESLKAMTGVFGGLGFDYNNTVDLVEELNNKIGESTGLGEQMTPVKEAFKILGLSFQEVSKLSPEEQFIKVADAAKNMEDAQKAAAAADILMGGEANKMIGYLRTQEGSFEDLMNAQRQYNMLTDDGIKGAKDSSKEFGVMGKVLSSLGQELAGQIGRGLAVVTRGLNYILVPIAGFIASGIDTFVDGVAQGFDIFSSAAIGAFNSIKDLAQPVIDLIPMFDGFAGSLDITQGIAIVAASGFTILTAAAISAIPAMISFAASAIAAAAPFIAIGLAITALVVIIEDLYSWISGGESIFKGLYEGAVVWIDEMVNFIDGRMMAMKESILSVFSSFSDYLPDFDSMMPDWAKDMMGFETSVSASPSAEMPASVYQGAGGSTSTTNITQNINGAGDPRAVGDRVVSDAGINSVASQGNYSYTRFAR